MGSVLQSEVARTSYATAMKVGANLSARDRPPHMVTASLTDSTRRSFAFGPFLLVPHSQLLLHDEAPVHIGGRALDILTALVERHGELVSKSELMARVWPRTVVEECNLKVNIAALRRALGDGPETAKYIATVTRRGYRFTAPVQAGEMPGFVAPGPSTHRRTLPSATTKTFGRADAIDAVRQGLNGARLVLKQLDDRLRRLVDGDGTTYRLLENTRAYCLERLQSSGDDHAATLEESAGQG